MIEQKPASRYQTLAKWLVPIAAIMALGAWIYIAPPGLMGKLDAIGYAVCHRLSSHSLFVDGIQFPLCARCTGEFNAAAIALVLQGLISRKKSKLPKRGIIAVLIVFFLAFAVDGSNSYLALLKQSYGTPFMNVPNLYVTNNVTRVFTGSGMGVAMASVLYPMYNQTIWRAPEDKPALEWLQFGLLVGIVLVFDFGALSNLDPALYFIAVLSTLGVLALLTMVFNIVWVMIMKQDNAFDHLHQLWLPAVAGLTLAFLLILGIDLFRFNLTHTWTGFPGLTG
ncbi:MAG TPA: DUF2085 domain-containing protein [Anaerolineales bacterium]|nr:DUF2085 domain-containing protein [Anaerolineales bacterium]